MLRSGARCALLRTDSTSLMRRVLVGGIVTSALASHGGARAMAAGGSIPAPADVAAPPADAKVTASGLAYKVLKAGSGAAPELVCAPGVPASGALAIPNPERR